MNNFDSKKYTWKSSSIQKILKPNVNEIFSITDVEYATILLKNKEYADRMFPNNEFYRIHTKGKGAKCISKEGIKRGSFIVEYFG